MQFFPNPSTIIQIGDFAIRWYAILILSGAFFAYYLSLRELKKMGYDASIMDDLFFGALISGVIGTRLWYVAFSDDLAGYLANPLRIVATWEGGLAIQGGLFLGGLYGYYWVKKRKISFMRVADAVVPTIMVAQAIGRWGNFANQEAFGRIVDPSFYAGWPTWIANHMLIGGSYREPTFFYESIGNIIGYLLIIYVYKKYTQVKRGDMVYAYLMWYGVLRFFVEGLRSDSLYFMGLRSAQLVSIAFVIVGMLGTLGVFRKMFPRKKPIILFDFDGTVMDTEPAILKSYEVLYERYGKSDILTPEFKKTLMGPPLKEIFAMHFDEDKVEDLVLEYREINIELHKTDVKPFEGVKEVLTSLKEQGYRCGIVSSKHSDSIEYALGLYDMQDFFEVVIGLNHTTHHKPHKEPLEKGCKAMNVGHDSLIYVGDTVMDVQSATAIGAYSVVYGTNEERLEKISSYKPNKIIRSWDEFMPILQEDVEWTRSTI
ncbi:MAG: prolipoprotein diacylglyceryl transferase [Erysipelothrix sp.]|jgi:phosphatidylglycerol:prolipoprotein diacylglycerol transferase|nr:prolipoprotein diacylglyceryl transferase [Erysipelothrix sp.]